MQIWESPSLIIPLALAVATPGCVEGLVKNPWSKRTLLMMAFLCHYTYRTIVFPLRTIGGKPAPASVMLLGFSFCVWNGFLQGYYLVHQLPAASPVTPQVLVGLSMWALGWYVGACVKDVGRPAFRFP